MAEPPPSSTQAAQSRSDLTQYVTQTAQLLGLSIPASQMPRVIEQFEQIQTIAQPVLAFSLPDDLDPAPRFEP